MGRKFEKSKISSKLKKLSPHSESIQDAANYFFSNKKHGEEIVALWLDAFKKGDDKSRLTLIYLANEVLQTCKRMNAPVYRQSWRPHLEACLSQLSSKSIIEKVARTVNIWRERAVYEDSYLNSLLKCLQGRRQPSADDDATTKIIENFNPEQPLELLQQMVTVEGELTQTIHHLDYFLVDPRVYAEDTTQFVSRIKDKEQGRKFVNRLSEDCQRLDTLRQTLEKEISLRKKLQQVLSNAEVFYEHQMKEVDVVVNAYKDYGRRLEEVRVELEKQRETLPDDVPGSSSFTSSLPLFSYMNLGGRSLSLDQSDYPDMSVDFDDYSGLDNDDGDDHLMDGFEDAPSPGNTPPHMKQGIQRVLNALDDGADSDDDPFLCFAKADKASDSTKSGALTESQSTMSQESFDTQASKVDVINSEHSEPLVSPINQFNKTLTSTGVDMDVSDEEDNRFTDHYQSLTRTVPLNVNPSQSQPPPSSLAEPAGPVNTFYSAPQPPPLPPPPSNMSQMVAPQDGMSFQHLPPPPPPPPQTPNVVASIVDTFSPTMSFGSINSVNMNNMMPQTTMHQSPVPMSHFQQHSSSFESKSLPQSAFDLLANIPHLPSLLENIRNIQKQTNLTTPSIISNQSTPNYPVTNPVHYSQMPTLQMNQGDRTPGLEDEEVGPDGDGGATPTMDEPAEPTNYRLGYYNLAVPPPGHNVPGDGNVNYLSNNVPTTTHHNFNSLTSNPTPWNRKIWPGQEQLVTSSPVRLPQMPVNALIQNPAIMNSLLAAMGTSNSPLNVHNIQKDMNRLSGSRNNHGSLLGRPPVQKMNDRPSSSSSLESVLGKPFLYP